MTDLSVPMALTPEDKKYGDTTPRVSSSLDPDGEESEIAAVVREMFQTARQARSPMVPIWNRCYRALRCRANSSVNAASWEPNIRIPEIFNIARSKVGLQLDQRIIADVSVEGPFNTDQVRDMQQKGEDLQTVLEATHFVNNEEIEYERALWDAVTYGTGILKTVWDGTLADGLGDAVIRRVSPYCVFPDPAAGDEKTCDYIIEARTVSVQQLDRQFPGKGELFLHGGASDTTDLPPSQLQGSTQAQSRLIPGPISPATSPRRGREVGGPSARTAYHAESITLLECWIREHDVTEVEGGPDDGAELVEDRWRVVVVAGDHVLMNERAEDLWDHGGHPYDRFVPQDLGEFWGLGIVELLGPIQASLNRMLQAIQRHIEITGNPILKEDYGAMTQGGNLQGNKPGQRISKRQGRELEWMTPPPFSPQTPGFLDYVLGRMEAVSGLKPLFDRSGRPSSDVMDASQEIAFVAVRAELLNLEHGLRGAYVKKASLIAQNYTEARWVSITGPEGQQSQMFLSARHFLDDDPAGGAPLEYTVRIDAGSSASTSRKVRHDLATQALTLGAISRMDWLEAVEWPNTALAMERKAAEDTSVLATNEPGKRERARA